MRCALAGLSILGLLACTPQDAETMPDASAPQPPASAAAGDHLDFSCDNRLYAFASGGATIENLRAALGEANVVEASDYDDVWVSLYPGDPAREVRVWLDSGGRVRDVRVENPASAARLGGVLRMGDDLAAVQQFNGAALPLDGSFLQSFAVADDPDSLCRYGVNVRTEAAGADRTDGTGASDPAARPPGLRVSALHMSRR